MKDTDKCFSGSFGTVYHADWRGSVNISFLYLIIFGILFCLFWICIYSGSYITESFISMIAVVDEIPRFFLYVIYKKTQHRNGVLM
jgi:hypothetical protein